MSKKQLLTIDAFIPERDFITIRLPNGDAKNFDLRLKDELSLQELAEVRDLAKGLEEKLGPDMTAETLQQLNGFCDQVIHLIVIDMDPQTLAALKAMDKFRIVQVFTQLAGGGAIPATEQMESSPESQPTGEPSSPSSGASTAAP